MNPFALSNVVKSELNTDNIFLALSEGKQALSVPKNRHQLFLIGQQLSSNIQAVTVLEFSEIILRLKAEEWQVRKLAVAKMTNGLFETLNNSDGHIAANILLLPFGYVIDGEAYEIGASRLNDIADAGPNNIYNVWLNLTGRAHKNPM